MNTAEKRMQNTPSMQPEFDLEITLRRRGQELVVSPYGASLRRYRVSSSAGSWKDIVWGYSGKDSKQGGQGDVLFPFPSRIPFGKYSFEGRDYQIPCNDKEGQAAIHGFLRAETWNLDRNHETEAVF